MTAKPSYEELERRVHELEKLESELEYSREMLRVYEKASLGYQSLDENGHYITLNQTWLDTLGCAKEEVIGKSFADFIHPDWRDHFKENFPRFKSIGEILGVEFEMVKKNGDLIQVSLTENISRNKKGDFQQTHCIFHDITKRKGADITLRKTSESLQAILDNSPTLISEFDLEGRYTRVNPAVAKLLKRRPSELIGRTFKEILSADMAELFMKRVKLVSNAREPITVEDHIVTPEGGQYFITTIFPLFDASGQVRSIGGIANNITERKQAETDRENLHAQLIQAQKMESIGTLAGGIAHDFNNILFPIIDHSEILMGDAPKDSPIQESFKEIYTSAMRAKDLVQQILAFARQEKNELRMMRMQPIIKEALKLIQSTIPTTIAISRNIQPDCGAVKAYPTQIHQIVMNLTTNAWHAMAETGGKLSVSLKQIELDEYNQVTPEMSPGPYARLIVADTGTGMDQELIHRIFDPFFTTKEKGRVTGMGLSVIHGIVKSMNGAIQVYSQPGKGSEFHVYLPVVETVSQTQKIKTRKPIPGGMERILLIDDETAIIALEKVFLSRLCYQVTTSTSSTQALEIFRTSPDQFDLVITDMAMPNMSGDRLARELIKIRPDIPILLCTGFSDRITDDRIKSLGIRGLLSKPLIIRDYAEKIREVLDNASAGTNE